MGLSRFFHRIGCATVPPCSDAWNKGCPKASRSECWDISGTLCLDTWDGTPSRCPVGIWIFGFNKATSWVVEFLAVETSIRQESYKEWISIRDWLPDHCNARKEFGAMLHENAKTIMLYMLNKVRPHWTSTKLKACNMFMYNWVIAASSFRKKIRYLWSKDIC